MATKVLTKNGLDTFWAKVKTKISSDITSGTANKVSKALTFGSKSYDGSEAKEITAADLGALTSINFSDLPDMYWADIKVTDSASVLKEPSFAGMKIGRYDSITMYNHQFQFLSLSDRNFANKRLILRSLIGGTTDLARFYNSGTSSFKNISLFDAETDATNAGFDNLIDYNSTNHAFRVKGKLETSGSTTADSFVKAGGTSTEFLMADGHVGSFSYDSNTGTLTITTT